MTMPGEIAANSTSKGSQSSAGTLTLGMNRPPQKPRQVRRIASKKTSHSDFERKRRQNMNSLIMTLQSLLPVDIYRKTKRSNSDILGESLEYISVLQRKLEELAQKKAQITATQEISSACDVSSRTERSTDLAKQANVDLCPFAEETALKIEVNSCQRDVLIMISTYSRGILLSEILHALQENNLEILNAWFSRNAHTVFLSIHAQLASSVIGFSANVLHHILYDRISKTALSTYNDENGEETVENSSNSSLAAILEELDFPPCDFDEQLCFTFPEACSQSLIHW